MPGPTSAQTDIRAAELGWTPHFRSTNYEIFRLHHHVTILQHIGFFAASARDTGASNISTSYFEFFEALAIVDHQCRGASKCAEEGYQVNTGNDPHAD